MNKIQAYFNFWSSFGLAVYDETSVPDTAVLPYITVEASSDVYGAELALTASLWYRSTSWTDVTLKEMQISEAIGRGGKMVTYDGGAFWIRRGTPWAQRMSEASDDSVRRIVLNVLLEFID